jgi:hypothetical protein
MATCEGWEGVLFLNDGELFREPVVCWLWESQFVARLVKNAQMQGS